MAGDGNQFEFRLGKHLSGAVGFTPKWFRMAEKIYEGRKKNRRRSSYCLGEKGGSKAALKEAAESSLSDRKPAEKGGATLHRKKGALHGNHATHHIRGVLSMVGDCAYGFNEPD
jgi:hypothetical protein